LKTKTRAEAHGIQYKLGCDMNSFMRYISDRFRIGMCWKNYGVKWELDHIIPVSYVLKDEFKKLVKNKQEYVKQKITHYTNIQPLFNAENAKKRANIVDKAKRMLNK
jgi:hypothetical protein